MYSAVRALKEAGAEVTVLALGPSLQNGNKTEDFHIQHLKNDLGIRFEIISQSPRIKNKKKNFLKHFFPSEIDLLPAIQNRSLVSAKLDELKPDGILAYHWDALASVYQLYNAPKLGLVGDPMHLPQLFRKELNSRYKMDSLRLEMRGSFRDFIRTPQQIKLMQKLMNDCDQSGAFAAHHSEMFQELGVKNCHYFRTPTPDPITLDSSKYLKSKKLKILHIGHLQGIATLSGVELIANEILPILDQKLGQNGFEIHLVGGYFDLIPEGLKKKLLHPSVKIRGQINPPDSEFFSSHLILVPTPIELGIRVRIITAFSFGTCIVAHIANKKGIPELNHLENAMLGSSGEELAAHCLEVFKNPSLRENLEKESRNTYEKYFALDVAGKAISDALQSLVRERKDFNSSPVTN
ncbi:MAG: glycosyltransferase [Deltaproteobacteria bacterium]|nr:glycosyltransferase [Deltaproteobacteria bacterium]